MIVNKLLMLRSVKASLLNFAGLPHRTKIFVAGNHETNFPKQSREHTAVLLAPSCIYLEDASITVSGIHFYGSPWNVLRHNSFARAFSISYSSLPAHWREIPQDTDVLVTHSPAYGVSDLGSNKHMLNTTRYCDLCQDYHKVFTHFGCPSLLDEIRHRVRYRYVGLCFVLCSLPPPKRLCFTQRLFVCLSVCNFT